MSLKKAMMKNQKREEEELQKGGKKEELENRGGRIKRKMVE